MTFGIMLSKSIPEKTRNTLSMQIKMRPNILKYYQNVNDIYNKNVDIYVMSSQNSTNIISGRLQAAMAQGLCIIDEVRFSDVVFPHLKSQDESSLNQIDPLNYMEEEDDENTTSVFFKKSLLRKNSENQIFKNLKLALHLDLENESLVKKARDYVKLIESTGGRCFYFHQLNEKGQDAINNEIDLILTLDSKYDQNIKSNQHYSQSSMSPLFDNTVSPYSNKNVYYSSQFLINLVKSGRKKFFDEKIYQKSLVWGSKVLEIAEKSQQATVQKIYRRASKRTKHSESILIVENEDDVKNSQNMSQAIEDDHLNNTLDGEESPVHDSLIAKLDINNYYSEKQNLINNGKIKVKNQNQKRWYWANYKKDGGLALEMNREKTCLLINKFRPISESKIPKECKIKIIPVENSHLELFDFEYAFCKSLPEKKYVEFHKICRILGWEEVQKQLLRFYKLNTNENKITHDSPRDVYESDSDDENKNEKENNNNSKFEKTYNQNKTSSNFYEKIARSDVGRLLLANCPIVLEKFKEYHNLSSGSVMSADFVSKYLLVEQELHQKLRRDFGNDCMVKENACKIAKVSAKTRDEILQIEESDGGNTTDGMKSRKYTTKKSRTLSKKRQKLAAEKEEIPKLVELTTERSKIKKSILHFNLAHQKNIIALIWSLDFNNKRVLDETVKKYLIPIRNHFLFESKSVNQSPYSKQIYHNFVDNFIKESYFYATKMGKSDECLYFFQGILDSIFPLLNLKNINDKSLLHFSQSQTLQKIAIRTLAYPEINFTDSKFNQSLCDLEVSVIEKIVLAGEEGEKEDNYKNIEGYHEKFISAINTNTGETPLHALFKKLSENKLPSILINNHKNFEKYLHFLTNFSNPGVWLIKSIKKSKENSRKELLAIEKIHYNKIKSEKIQSIIWNSIPNLVKKVFLEVEELEEIFGACFPDVLLTEFEEQWSQKFKNERQNVSKFEMDYLLKRLLTFELTNWHVLTKNQRKELFEGHPISNMLENRNHF